MIQARNLTKIFRDKKRGEIRAVDNVSFTCEPGKIYGLLGANGAGKTTTLRLLATLLAPTAGDAVVAGFDVATHPAHVRARVGFLAASTALYGRLTVSMTHASPVARPNSRLNSAWMSFSTAAWTPFQRA
jgi:sodium transport system ATP-binding protein